MGGVVAVARGGVGRRAFSVLCDFAIPEIDTLSRLDALSIWAAGCSWGAPWGRGARVEVWRVLGVGGVVPMAAGGMDLCAITASCSFALPSFATASGGARPSDRAACCSWGAPWGRGALVEVWWPWGVGCIRASSAVVSPKRDRLLTYLGAIKKPWQAQNPGFLNGGC